MTTPDPVLILKTGRYVVHHGAIGVIRSLGRLGVPVYSVNEGQLAPARASRYLTGTVPWSVGNLSRAQMLEALSKIGRKLGQSTILIPTDDLAAILIAEEAATLREWFVFPRVSPWLPVNLANKAMLHGLCSLLGVACPQTLVPTSLMEVNEFAESVGFPLVVKPAAAWLDPNLKVSIVQTERQLLDIWNRREKATNPNLMLQEYIPGGEDWFFHGYCTGAADCVAGFTGVKLRSFPPHAGITSLGKSVTNAELGARAEALLKAISYAGIMDIDYRLDPRDGRYKLLDFNPRIGAQFRVFEDENGIDVARALYRDLTGQPVERAKQVDGRILVVEPYDIRSSLNYLWRGKLSVNAWLRSFRGDKEFAWSSWDDPLPALVALAHLAIGAVAKTTAVGLFKPDNSARNCTAAGRERKQDQPIPVAPFPVPLHSKESSE